MTSKEKRFDQIIGGLLKTYRFAAIQSFLEHYGFYSERNGSSHYVFRRSPYPHIIIVAHKGHVKRWYVKRMVEILRENEIIK